MNQYSNSAFDFSIEQRDGTFSIDPVDSSFPAIINAQITVSGSYKNKPFSLPLVLDPQSAQKRSSRLKLLSHRDHITFHPGTLIPGLDFEVVFAFPLEKPAVLWKVIISNQNAGAVFIDRIDLISKPSEKKESCLRLTGSTQALTFFVNGWQSWSFSGSTSSAAPQLRSRLGMLQNPMIVDAGLKNESRFAGIADMFAVLFDKEKEKGCLFGFLSQKEQFGHIALTNWKDPDISMWADGDGVRLDSHTSLQTDWAVMLQTEGSDSDCANSYFDMAARENKVSFKEKVLAGWCSWYQYYQKIDETVLRENLKVLNEYKEKLPLTLFQIDDGFESSVGDWFSFTVGFPNGVGSLAQEIKKEGYLPGLWLAPYILQRSSKLFSKHPDWILRKANGKPVNAGFGWGALTTALDITNSYAADYVRRVIARAVETWKYPYLKLDFLYAAALKGKYSDPTKTRAQVLRAGLEDIREIAGPSTYLVGCGLPLGSGLGIVDSMRIGPDVSDSWTPKYGSIRFILDKEPSVPSARNSLRNILTRANMHGSWWVNDPDCVLVRDQSGLTLAEVQTLASVVALSGGSLVFSDDLTSLTEERLHLASQLLPPISSPMIVLDWLQDQYPSRMCVKMEGALGEWDVLAQINWGDKESIDKLPCSSFNLEDGQYWVSDFWNKKIEKNDKDHSLGTFTIPAHGCLLLAVRPYLAEDQYIGSDLHFSQGMEVTRWSARKNETRFSLNPGKHITGSVFLSIPVEPQKVESSGDILNFSRITRSIYELKMRLEKPVSVSIKH